jgi:outer membrane protein TolC
MTLDQALAEAYTSREDLQAAQAMLHAAEAERQAAVGDALPSLRVSGDLGRSSSAWDTLHGTYAVSATVQVPIFQGGRVHGEMLQADAELKRQQAQVADLRARIEYEVRSALLDLQAADDRVRVAKSAADLAGQQLAQAQDRFTATDNYLSALYAHNLAKISLARAIGLAEERGRQLLRSTE